MVEIASANIGFFSSNLTQTYEDYWKNLTSSLADLKKKRSAAFNQTCLDNNSLPEYTTCIYSYHHDSSMRK